jgi:hypothetical protein
MNRRSALAMVIALVLTVAVLAVDRVAPPPEPTEPIEAAPVTVTPIAGASTCAVGDGRDGSELSVTAARPGEVGEGPAQVDVAAFEDGEERAIAVPPVFPGVHGRATVDGGDGFATIVRWRGAPVAVDREWELAGDDELPPGTIAGPCPSEISDRWVVPGMITVGGSEARLRVANPFGTDATVAVGFVTPEGPEQLLALQNLSVSAGGTLEIDVNEVMPERADLAAVVRVLSGRAIAEGYQLTRSEIGDIDGASLLAASTAPSETWTVPWVTDSETDDSWLWVVNLGDRPAPVEFTLHTADGGAPPEGLSEVTVAPGQLRRIDLRGTLPEGATGAAVTARSDGAPIHLSGVVQRATEDPATSAFAVQLGAPRSDTSWIVSGGAIGEGRREAVQVVNPGSEAAEFSVTLFNGSTVSRPADLADLQLGPGENTQLDLEAELADADSWSAFVTVSEGEVVVGRLGVGGREGGLHLVAAPGAPSVAWSTAGNGLSGRAVVGLVQQLGTRFGVGYLGVRADDTELPVTPPGLDTDTEGPDTDHGTEGPDDVTDGGPEDEGPEDEGPEDEGPEAGDGTDDPGGPDDAEG